MRNTKTSGDKARYHIRRKKFALRRAKARAVKQVLLAAKAEQTAAAA